MTLRVLSWGVDPPPISNLDEYVSFMSEHDVDVVREYVLPHDDDDWEPFWSMTLKKESPLPDGRIYMQFIQTNERHVAMAWKEAWAMEVQLIDAALERALEAHG